MPMVGLFPLGSEMKGKSQVGMQVTLWPQGMYFLSSFWDSVSVSSFHCPPPLLLSPSFNLAHQKAQGHSP